MATEKRLIYLDDIKDALRSVSEDTTCPVHIAAEIDQIVELAPTVDAVEVVYGEWSTVEDDYTGMIALECSECKEQWWFEDEPPMKIYKYCPNCGAIMNRRMPENAKTQ